MSAITWPDVVDIAPELVDYPVNAQNMILAYINDSINAEVLDGEDGSKTKLARVNLAAHIATMLLRANRNQTGAVVSESLGPQSRAYASMAGVLGDKIEMTQYGQIYQMIVRWSNARGPRIL